MFLFCFCPQCDMPHYCPWFFRFVLMDVLVTTDVGLQATNTGKSFLNLRTADLVNLWGLEYSFYGTWG